MCGIVGYLDLAGRKAAQAQTVQLMLDALVHRGPDSDGKFCNGPVALGFRRLSIIDLGGSNQPLFNEDRSLAVVGNGEIYNYLELRKALISRGHVFSTNGDIEVVLHLFEEMGLELTRQLNGQFSLAILEVATGRLHLIRDPFGITPLFHASFGQTFVFASEVKAILRHPAASAALDIVALDQALCFPGIVSPRSMFRGIQSLSPGHSLTVDGQRLTLRRYWDLDYPPASRDNAGQPDTDVVGTFRTLFDRSVELRLRADVPVGLYLSGGLDSSYIGASLRSVAPDTDLTTFSIVFPNNRAINERKFQLQMAAQLGSHHVEIPFDADDIFAQMRRMIWHAEVPVTETYNICSMAMSAAARAHGVKVVLAGEGADELLAGYPGYRFDALSAASGSAGVTPQEALARQEVWGDAAVRYERRYGEYRAFRNRFLSRSAREALADSDCLSQPPVDAAMLRGRAAIHQRSYLDTKLRLADHLLGDHGDRMAMANSVEVRYPFLDRDLVAFLTQIDPAHKLSGMDEKAILRRAAQARLPPEILRREKFGFRAPGSAQLLGASENGTHGGLAAMLSRDRIEADGVFDHDAIQAEVMRNRYPGAGANPHADDDVPLLAITVSILMETFGVAAFA